MRDPTPYFEGITAEADPEAVKLVAELIERESGRFEPEKMADQCADAVREMIQAKIEQRAPEIAIASEGKHRMPVGPKRHVAPLTSAECTKLGGVVDARDKACTDAGKFTCTTTDSQGNNHTACIDKLGKVQ